MAIIQGEDGLIRVNLLKKNIFDSFSDRGFFFSKEILSRYYMSLKSKPFVILSGISGTGKTKIAQIFAEYMCQDDTVDKKKMRMAFVAVRPDWMDHKGLLGYYNILDEKYHSTKVLDLLLNAAEERDKPFFVVLDEMNLAKVEHYFSDFLSIMESRTSDNPDGETIDLHPFSEVEDEKGRKIPGKIHIPANVFFTGTVNVDESTYMFSPKVLDRANVIEFNEVDLESYAGKETDDAGIALLRGNVLDRLFEPQSYRICSKVDYQSLPDQAQQCIEQIHNILGEYNLHFGYRVANELGRFVSLALEEMGNSYLDDVIDIQILQKILPKLHGTRAKLEEPLKKLLVFCNNGKTIELKDSIQAATGSDRILRFPRSGRKIERMLKQLTIQGYASFVE